MVCSYSQNDRGRPNLGRGGNAADLVERGLDARRMRLWVFDGGKPVRKAITQTFAACALIQRCQEHQLRNMLEHLPEDAHASVKRPRCSGCCLSFRRTRLTLTVPSGRWPRRVHEGLPARRALHI